MATLWTCAVCLTIIDTATSQSKITKHVAAAVAKYDILVFVDLCKT